MAKYVRGTTNTTIFGRKFYKGGAPVIGALVVLQNLTDNLRVAKTTTDRFGRWTFDLPNASIPAGRTFEIRYYGAGLIQGTPPNGDWELFETKVDPLGQSVAIFYRGEYDPAKTYYYNSQRRDVVRYSGSYFLCNTDQTTGAWDPSKWDTFAGQFSSVATDILLAQDAYITRALVLGADDQLNYGILRSLTASGVMDGNGFYMANTSGGTGYFRIGAVSGGTLINGLSWDGPNNLFQIKASNFELTTSGYMWANAGGFAGTSSALPKILLDNEGMFVKDAAGVPTTFVTGNNNWRYGGPALMPATTNTNLLNGNFSTGSFSPGWSVGGSDALPTVVSDSGNYVASFPRYNNGAYIEQTFNVNTDNVYTISFNVRLNYTTPISGSGHRLRFSTVHNSVTTTTEIIVDKNNWRTVNIPFVTTTTGTLKIRFEKYWDSEVVEKDCSLYLDNVVAKYYSPYSELNAYGLVIANTPTSYIRFGKGLAEIVTDILQTNNLTVNGTLTILGDTITTGTEVTTYPIQVLNQGGDIATGYYYGVEIDDSIVGDTTNRLLVYSGTVSRWGIADRTTPGYGDPTTVSGFKKILTEDSSDIISNKTLAQNLLFNAEGTYDIGTVSANRPRNLYMTGNQYVGGNILASATGQDLGSATAYWDGYLQTAQFDTTYAAGPATGRLSWNNDDGTLDLGLKGGNVTLQLGQETVAMCFNDEATTLVDGEIVYISGAQGQRPAVKRASATTEATSNGTFGMVTEHIASGGLGFVTILGLVHNINTLAYPEGTLLWLGSTPGTWTATKPQAPNHGVRIGYVARQHQTSGSIFVSIQNGSEFDELHDVLISSLTDGDLVVYNASAQYWQNSKTLPGTYHISGDLYIDGADLASTSSSFNLLNSGITDIHFGEAATAITIGATTGLTTLRTPIVNLSNLTALQVAGTPILNGSRNLTNIGTIESSYITAAHSTTPSYFIRNTTDTNTATRSMLLKGITTSNMVDGYGVGMGFAIQDDAAIENIIAGIYAYRNGADNSGRLSFQTTYQGASAERLYLDETGLTLTGNFNATGDLVIPNTKALKSKDSTGLLTNKLIFSASDLSATVAGDSVFMGNSIGGSPLTFYTGGNVVGTNERMTILSNGYFGFGTTVPNKEMVMVHKTSNFTMQINSYGSRSDMWLNRASGSFAAPTIPASGAILGNLIFGAYDSAGPGFVGTAKIETVVDATSGTGDLPSRMVFYTTPDNSTTMTERMRIDSNGRVRIGSTMTMGEKFSIEAGHIALENGYGLRIKNAAGTLVTVFYSGTSDSLANRTIIRSLGTGITFKDTGASTIAVLDDGGNFGVGLISPTYKISAAGTIFSTVGFLTEPATGAGYFQTKETATGNTATFTMAATTGEAIIQTDVNALTLARTTGYATFYGGGIFNNTLSVSAGSITLGDTIPIYFYDTSTYILRDGGFFFASPETIELSSTTSDIYLDHAAGSSINLRSLGSHNSYVNIVNDTYTLTAGDSTELSFKLSGPYQVDRKYILRHYQIDNTAGNTKFELLAPDTTAVISVASSKDVTFSNNITVTGSASIHGHYVGKGRLTTQIGNVVVGVGGLYNLPDNANYDHNTVIGAYGMYNMTNGLENFALGYSPLYNTTTGQRNVAIGGTSMFYRPTSNYNIGIGYRSLQGVNGQAAGDYNIAIGDQAGYQNYGQYNLFIGTSAAPSSGNRSYSTVIGHNLATPSNDSTLVIGVGNNVKRLQADTTAFYLYDSAAGTKFILTDAGNVTIGSTAGTGAGAIYLNSIYNGTTQVMDTSRNLLNIGTYTGYGKVTIQKGNDIGILLGADSTSTTLTDATIKAGRIGIPHYTNAEEPGAGLFLYSSSTNNELNIGGGTSLMNASTLIKFYTAANNTTTTGTIRLIIDESGGIGRVTLGASAGTPSGYLYSDKITVVTGVANALDITQSGDALDAQTVTKYDNNAVYGAGIVGKRALGNSVSPAGLTADVAMIGLWVKGRYDASNWGSNNVGAIRIMSGGTYSATSQPTYIDFATTAVSSTTRAVRMIIGSDGAVTIGGSAGTGSNSLYLNAIYNGTTQVMDSSRNLLNIGTISSGTINGQTITSAASFTGTVTTTAIDKFRHSVASNYSLNIDNTTANAGTAFSPVSKYLWHDLLSFNQWFSTPTFETYTGTWAADTLNSNLFIQKENQAVTVIDGVTKTAARWTWNNSSVSWSTVTWFLIGVTYTAVASSKDFLIESSADGITWTTRHTSTANTANAVPVLLAVSSWSGDGYVRLTITVTNGQALKLSAIKALSARWGDQGGGSEGEYPYGWDASRNITTYGYVVLGTQATTTTQAVRADRSLTFNQDTNVTITNNGSAQNLTADRSWTLGWTGQLSLARGGTNANLTAVAGGVVYSSASALAISAAGVTGRALVSGGTGSPTWYTATATNVFFAGVSGILADSSTFTYDDTAKKLTISGASITGASSTFTLTSTGNFVFDAQGAAPKTINALTNYTTNLGQIDKKYLSLHAAELVVETLVAQNTQATIGGRILVGMTAPLIADLAAGATTMDVKYSLGDGSTNNIHARLEANGNVEFIKLTSAATVISGGYRYTVVRDLDGTGSNNWYAGDAVFSTGSTGSGFIDIYSINSIKTGVTQAGPTIVGNVRTGTTYSDWAEHWAIGNLNNLYGQSSVYGVGLGKYATGVASSFVIVDGTNGIRMFKRTAGGTDTTNAQWKTDGTIVLGADSVSEVHMIMTSSGISMYDNTNKVLTYISNGNLTLGEVAGGEYINLTGTSGISMYSNSAERIRIGTDGSGWVANSNISWNTTGDFIIGGSAYIGGTTGWTIAANSISSVTAGVKLYADASAQYIAMGSTVPTSLYVNNGIWMKSISTDAEFRIGKVSGTAVTTGIYWDGTDFKVRFNSKDLITANASAATIAGWTATDTALYKYGSNKGIAFNTSNNAILAGGSDTGFEVWDSTTPKLFIGTKGSSRMDWGVSTAAQLTIWGTSAKVFETTATGANIGGWAVDGSKFGSTNLSGGGDGTYTTSGIMMHSTGYISAPNFALGTSTSKIAGWAFDSSTISNATAKVYLATTTATLTSPNAVLGYLGGTTSTALGLLGGYGLYAANAYLENNVNIVGTLAVGGGATLGNTTYIGKVKTNYLQNSNLNTTTGNGFNLTSATILTASIDSTIVAPDGTTGSIKISTNAGGVDSGAFLPSSAIGTSVQNNEWVVWSFYVTGDAAHLFSQAQIQELTGYTSLGATSFTTPSSTLTWQRVVVIGQNTTGSAKTFRVKLFNTQATSYPASKNFYFWGGQVEILPATPTPITASAYQKTDTSIAGTGYGLWSTNGGFGGTIQNPVVTLSDYGIAVKTYTGLAASTLAHADNGTYVGNYTADATFNGVILSQTGIRGWKDNATPIFQILTDGTANIAGWNFTTTTFSSGSIYLNSSTEKISLGGDISYNGTGIFLGKDGSYYKLSLKSASGDSLTWDGNGTLTVSGAVNADSGTFTNTVIIGGATNGTLQVGTGTNKINIVGTDVDSSTYIQIGSGGYNTTTAKFYTNASGQFSLGQKLLWDGSALSISGSVSITSGDVSIGTSPAWFRVDSAGNIWNGNASLSGAQANTFAVTASGIMYAITGYLGGATNGWQIAAGSITAVGTGIIKTSSTTTRVEMDSSGVRGYNGGNQRFNLGNDGSGWLGASNIISWTNAGVVNIAGWTATSDKFENGIAATVGSAKLRLMTTTTGGSYGNGVYGKGLNVSGDFGNGNAFNMFFGEVPETYSGNVATFGTTGAERYGIAYYRYTGQRYFEVSQRYGAGGSESELRANIASWNFNSRYIWSLSGITTPSSTPTDGLILEGTYSSTPGIRIYEGTAKRVDLGYLSSGVYGMVGYATDGTTKIFEMSDTQQMLAGWTFDDTKLTKSTTVLLSSSQNSGNLVLGTGATSVTTAGTSHLDGIPSGPIFYADGTGTIFAGGTARYLRYNPTNGGLWIQGPINTEGANQIYDQFFTDLTGAWTTSGSPVAANVTFNNKSIRALQVPDPGAGGVYGTRTYYIPVDPDEKYELSVWYNTNFASGASIYFGVDGYDASFASVALVDNANANDSNPYSHVLTTSLANGTYTYLVNYLFPTNAPTTWTKEGNGNNKEFRMPSNVRYIRLKLWFAYAVSTGGTGITYFALPIVRKVGSSTNVMGGWLASYNKLVSNASFNSVGGLELDASTQTINIYDNAATAKKRVLLGKKSASNYGLTVYDTDGSTTLFDVTGSTATIGSWIIGGSTLKSDSSFDSTGGILLDKTNQVIKIYDNAATAKQRVILGKKSASNYGMTIYGTDGSTVLFDVTGSTAVIGNWTITNTSIQTGAYNTNGTMYVGASGISLSNTFSVTSAGALTATSGSIAGWNFNDTYFYKGTGVPGTNFTNGVSLKATTASGGLYIYGSVAETFVTRVGLIPSGENGGWGSTASINGSVVNVYTDGSTTGWSWNTWSAGTPVFTTVASGGSDGSAYIKLNGSSIFGGYAEAYSQTWSPTGMTIGQSYQVKFYAKQLTDGGGAYSSLDVKIISGASTSYQRVLSSSEGLTWTQFTIPFVATATTLQLAFSLNGYRPTFGIDTITLETYATVSHLGPKGLFISNNPSSYIKLGSGAAEIIGAGTVSANYAYFDQLTSPTLYTNKIYSSGGDLILWPEEGNFIYLSGNGDYYTGTHNGEPARFIEIRGGDLGTQIAYWSQNGDPGGGIYMTAGAGNTVPSGLTNQYLAGPGGDITLKAGTGGGHLSSGTKGYGGNVYITGGGLAASGSGGYAGIVYLGYDGTNTSYITMRGNRTTYTYPIEMTGNTYINGTVTIPYNGGQTTLALTSTGTNTGITLGGDTNLYRQGADDLRTDDSFSVGTNLSVGTTSSAGYRLYVSGTSYFNSSLAVMGRTGINLASPSYYLDLYNATNDAYAGLRVRAGTTSTNSVFDFGSSSTSLFSMTADGSVTMTGVLIQNDVIRPYITVGNDNSATVTFTAKMKKFNNTDSANNRMLVHWWTSTSSYGAPATLSGIDTYSISTGTNFGTPSQTALNTAFTDSDETIVLTVGRSTNGNNTVYFHVEVQGILYTASATVTKSPA